jgi:hypothetical protein
MRKTDICSIINKAGDCYQQSPATTDNLILAGHGKASIPFFAIPCLQNNGGIILSYPEQDRTTAFNSRYVVDPVSGCWLWTGHVRNSNKYGYFFHKGFYGLAHRYSYQLHKGEIPDGMVVMHSCDTRRCVNPAHLSLGSQLENIQDAITKGRMGHRIAKSARCEIVRLYEDGNSIEELAVKYGAKPGSIQVILENYYKWE